MKQSVNERIKNLRAATRLTQKKFCAIADITEMTLYRAENGGNDVSLSTQQKISDAFQVPIEWLTEGKGKMSFVIPEEKRGDALSPWKDEAYQAEKRRADFLEKQVEQLMSLLNAMTGKLGKLKALNPAEYLRKAA